MSSIITANTRISAANTTPTSTAQASALFGYSCAISGNYLVVGAYNETHLGYDKAGAAYIYYWNGSSWGYNKRISAADTTPTSTAQVNGWFGSSCGMSGNYLVVGSYYENSGQGAAYIYNLSGGTWSFNKRISKDDSGLSQSTAYFGFSCAMSENYLIVGAYNETHSSVTYSGAAYIYKLSGSSWVFNKRISMVDSGLTAQGSAYFGSSCGISNNYLVVGAFNENSGQGAAYIFSLNNSIWSFNKRISTADFFGTSLTTAYFGYSCGLSGNYLVVGAYTETYTSGSSLSNAGAAYIYVCNGSIWNFNKRITAVDAGTAQATAQFGYSCAISGNYLVVGAWQETYTSGTSLSQAGAIYVYYWNGSTMIFKQRISAVDSPGSTSQGGAKFGNSCAISGNYLVTGAFNEDQVSPALNNSGAAYVYNLGLWSCNYIKKILQSDSGTTIAGSSYFGQSCAISGNYFVIGAHTESNNKGAAYVYYFNGTTWDYKQKLLQSDSGTTKTSTYFGVSCAINGEYIIIGASTENTNIGAAYVYYFDGTAWVYKQKLLQSDSGTTLAGSYYFGNSCAISGNYMVISAYSKATVYVYYFNGTTWVYNQTLLQTDSGTTGVNSSFGWSCDINSSYIVIGAFRETGNSGAAYVYNFNGTTWVYKQKFTQGYSLFGSSCSISNNYIVIGARNEGIYYNGAAYVYYFNGTSWVYNTTFYGSHTDNASFGWSCAMRGSYMIIGATSDNGIGAIYMYYLNGETWTFKKQLLQLDSGTMIKGTSFGYSCAISDNYIVIGANGENTNTGSGYIYYYNNLSSITPVLSNGFINGCAISSNNIVVGNTGKTHTFKWSGSTWNTLSTIN